MKHYSTYQSQFIEMFGSESNKVLLEDVVFVKDDCRKPINEGVRSEMKEGELYPYYGATGVVDYINDYITDEELLCVAEDCGNYNAGEESAYIIRGKAWVNNHAHLVKMKDSCDIKYLYYYLKIANLMPYVSGTTRLKLTQKKLREIPVVLPTKDKQTTFVAIAEQADKSKFISLKSQFIEMFGQVSEESPCLNDIAQVYDGTHKTPTYTESGIPFISVENISDVYGSKKYISKDDYDLYKHKPEYGDIFMTRIGSIGKCAVYESHDPLAYYVSLALIKPNKDIVHPKFLKYYIESTDGALELKKRSLLKAFPMKINLGEIGKIKVIVPAKDKQLEFVKVAEQADKSKYIN